MESGADELGVVVVVVVVGEGGSAVEEPLEGTVQRPTMLTG